MAADAVTTPCELPAHDALDQALARAGAVHSAAEVHGLLCGLLVKDATASADVLVGQVLGEVAPGDLLVGEAEQMLRDMHAVTRGQLQDPALGLRLLLPPGEAPLQQRLEAVRAWASGLLYGLAAAGLTDFRDLPEDTASFIEDCRTIARTEFEARESEDAEAIYADVLEYLRMGTLLAQEELQPVRAAPHVH